jgi:hypothetical protein
LFDGKPGTEYSSKGLGTGTYVEVDFGQTVTISGFRHVDRNDPATVGKSKLQLLTATGQQVLAKDITHVNRRAGVTFVTFAPVKAQRARWQITQLGSPHGTVGGAEINFYAPVANDPLPSALAIRARSLQLLERSGQTGLQPIEVTIDSPYAEDLDAIVQLRGTQASQPVKLKFGEQSVAFRAAPVTEPQEAMVDVSVGNARILTHSFTRSPVRQLTVYVLPHSHIDIGYTALQADVEAKQNDNMEAALRLARETASYPEGSRFKWNVEVLWPVENYLRQATPEKRAAFLKAVKSGQVGLDAFYGNILTGLCRPEELLQLMSYATRLSKMSGVAIESAMISDVPGYTWSTVSAMAEAGVKYFSFAPNYFDRMGGTMKEWQNRPFWWVGPNSQDRVLCWCPSRGYALGHLIGDGEALARFMPEYLTELETSRYPYDITHLRWNVHGDNGSPDDKIAGVIRDWNAKYVFPRLIISTTAEAFRAFEKRYGEFLPTFAGDYTPYWEDGAGSSALETAMNRASAERLVQAETLWSLREPGAFPAEKFHEAWRNVLLYSEHTWGAHNSISQPDLPFVRDQWKVKRGFAVDADQQSRKLLEQALASTAQASNEIEVFNTTSWKRSDLVTLAGEMARLGDEVLDSKGKVVPSQRLSTGELVFVADDVPPFSAKRYSIRAGLTATGDGVKAQANELVHPDFKIVVHEQTGGIKSLYSRKLKRDLVKRGSSTGFNEFFYLPGGDLKDLERNGVPTIRVKETGPIVASLLVESAAPGCKSLAREIRVVKDSDRIEFINTIDKLPVRAKEGLHFGYDFDIPGGDVCMDVGWAVVRPEVDQIPASCKNWFSVQRWVDVSNDDFGVTWVPVDAPLVELGGITANLIGSQTDWRPWIQHLKPTTRLYSWVMNNHWHTNYRADQEGPTVFRYAIRPHKDFDAAEAERFGTECSQPLLVSWARHDQGERPNLRLSRNDVIATVLKPADFGKGWIVRLYGVSDKARKLTLQWTGSIKPKRIFLSDLSEEAKELVTGPTVDVPAWGIVTLRAE